MDAGRRPLHLLRTFPLLILLAHVALGQVTEQRSTRSTTTSATDTQAPGALPTPPAYDQTRLIPPPLPQPLPATTFTLALPRDASEMQNLSNPHVGGGLFGFSIEMSVLNQVGKFLYFSNLHT